MDKEQLAILLNNKLNSLNQAIGSAMQSGYIDVVESLTNETLQIKAQLDDLQSEE